MDNLQASIRKRPFGNRDELATESNELAGKLDELAQRLETEPMTSDKAELLRSKLCEAALTEGLDYDSARQIVWAFQIVDGELVGEGGRTKDDRIVRQIKELEQNVLILDLKKRGPEAAPEPDAINEQDLKRTLRPIQLYCPEKLRAAFRSIRKALDDQKRSGSPVHSPTRERPNPGTRRLRDSSS